MIDEYQNIFNNIKSVYSKELLSFLSERINFFKGFIKAYYNLLERFNDNLNPTLDNYSIHLFIHNFKELKIQLGNLLVDRGNTAQANKFDEDFKSFIEKIGNLLKKLPEKKIEYQSAERFLKNKNDKLLIKSGKFFKRIFFSVSKLPVSFVNIFAKIFKKKLKPAKLWKQIIPFKNLCEFYLKENLLPSYFILLRKINQTISADTLKSWESFEKTEKFFIDSMNKFEIGNSELKISRQNFSDYRDQIINELDSLKEEIHNEFDKIVETAFADLQEAYIKAGTIELPGSKFSDKKLRTKHSDLNKNYFSLAIGWVNTFYALYEDWKLNIELYLLRNITLERYYRILTKVNNDIHDKIIPEYNLLLRRFEKIRIDLRRADENQLNLKKVLNEAMVTILDYLKSTSIPKINELVMEQNITLLLDEFENISSESTEKISEKRAVVSTELYDKELKNSEINFVSPKEIIHFESLPKFINATLFTKNTISNEIQSIQNDLNSLVEIFKFNLESAQAALETETKEAYDAKFIAIEGVDRTISNAVNIKEKIKNLSLTISDVLKRSVDDFNNDVTKLTRTEKVLEIRLKIVKAKAKQKSNEFKKQLLEQFKTFLPQIITYLRNTVKNINVLFSKISRAFGFIEKTKAISTEISDFLAETKISIELLPFIYRRLFRIEPLVDDRFFITRDLSVTKLKTAFSNWQKERFASCAIVGEKGSGSTTFINFYLKNLKPKYKTLRITLTENIFDVSIFFKFMQDFLGSKDINSVNDIITFLNNSDEKRIIVIENIQHLYLKIVGGFTVLKMIFEIISKTNKSTFWLMSSSLYAWKYLNKTINIADQFGYVIPLEDLSEDQIKQVIFKRHKVSGYNIYFEPSEDYVNKKSFKKMNPAERQEFLKNEFFSFLYRFSKSNLSLALLYWLRTTKEVSGDTITIRMMENIDYSFLNMLSLPKTLTLHCFLIHDGLSISDHARIFNQDIAQSKLLFITMMDDGLLIKNEEIFNINPLLYRQIVNVLKSKNFIH